jgi:hypothetical protein
MVIGLPRHGHQNSKKIGDEIPAPHSLLPAPRSHTSFSHARSGSFYGAPFPGPWTRRTLRIHYHEFSDAAERVDALFAAMSDEEENPEGELYVLSVDTYDPYSARSFDLLDSATS